MTSMTRMVTVLAVLAATTATVMASSKWDAIEHVIVLVQEVLLIHLLI
jgi:phospholipase C